MIKKTAFILAVILLLTSINSCYFDRDINDELEICYLNGGNNYLCTMDIDGSNNNQLIPVSNIDHPSWSPDGEKIIFRVSDPYFNIYIVNADRTNLRKITKSTNVNIGNHFPTWSSDGERIIYTEDIDGTRFIHIANTEGTILKSFTTYNNLSVEGLSSSPDGNYIYYNGVGTLYRIDIESGTQTNLSINLDEFSISPDGKNIAYSYGPQVNIYNIDIGTSILFGTGTNPCWTPDGKTIIYVDSGNIYSKKIDGTNQRPLTNSVANSSPCVKWKPI